MNISEPHTKDELFTETSMPESLNLSTDIESSQGFMSPYRLNESKNSDFTKHAENLCSNSQPFPVSANYWQARRARYVMSALNQKPTAQPL